MSSLYVTLDILPGATIKRAVEDMVVFVNRHDIACVINFNGIRIRANEGAIADEIIQRYEEVILRRQVASELEEEG